MRNFYPFPYAPYNGTFSARPFNGAGGQKTMINALVKWFTYSVAGHALGTQRPEFNVNIDLNAAASNTVNLNWVIRSVYIDNAGVNFTTFIYFPSTGFSISCPANSSGWYQVFTFDRRAWICGLGISDVDIGNQATTNVFFTDAVVNSYLDQEAPTAVNMKLSSPLISIGGGGGQVTSVKVLTPGQWCDNGGLAISGGGGSGAAAHGYLNSFGQFISAGLASGGSGYSGAPDVLYSGGYLPPPPWDYSYQNYVYGQLVRYNGYVYSCLVAGAAGIPNGPSGGPTTNTVWAFTGYTSAFIAPILQATVSPIVGASTFSNVGIYGPAALGDQLTPFVDQLSLAGVFHDNVFGTPYANGFIYLTNIDVKILNSDAGTSCRWSLEDQDGNVVFQFSFPLYSTTMSIQPVLSLQGCNLKLPANLKYRLKISSITGIIWLQHYFAWTYSPAFS